MSWSNWGGNQRSTPSRTCSPRDADQVATVITRAARSGQQVRAVGAGHSFTPVASTDGVQLRLDQLTGIVSVDPATRRVRVRAGTSLHVLNPALEAIGLALPNLGDIDRQTIAGAISTGTHGTGSERQGIAAAVTGLTLVLADGSVRTCSAEEDPDLLDAARVSLGALGVIIEVELQCVPAFRLRAVEQPMPLDELLATVQDLTDAHHHLDAYWFPHTAMTQVKLNDTVEANADEPGPLGRWRAWLDDDLLSNRVFELTNRLAVRRPSVITRLNQVSARALSARTYTDVSWKVFCSAREVRFTESEYAVPRAAVTDVVRELRDWIDQSSVSITFPVEIRFAAADDVWLSTAYQRDNAYVAVHQYHRTVDRSYFAAFEAIARAHEGRPHWGKLHTLARPELAALYPRFDDFVALRDHLDPDRRFGNPHLTSLFG